MKKSHKLQVSRETLRNLEGSLTKMAAGRPPFTEWRCIPETTECVSEDCYDC